VAKFYFHLRDGVDHVLDPEGSDYADLERVKLAALAAARDLIAADAGAGLIDLRCRIEVENASGHVVHALEFEEAVTIKRAA
jgi:hypothetical protein